MLKHCKCSRFCRFDSNTDQSVENNMHNDVFLTSSEVFDVVVNYCLECLILLLEQLN